HVSVAVHEAGRHHLALGVQDLLGRFTYATDGGDLAPLDAYICAISRASGPVHHPAVLDQEIKGHRSAPFDAGVHRSIVASWYSTARSLRQRPFLVRLPRDGPRDLRPSRPSGRAGARALREPAAPPGEVRRGGLPLVSPGRAPRDAAGPGPRARHLPRCG